MDDDEKLLKLYSAILTKEGYEVLTVSDSKKCGDLVVSAKPDLILLDVIMPGMDGGELCEQLAENPAAKDISVAFLTSLVNEEEVEYGKGNIGGREYISKATPKEKFIARIKKILSGGVLRHRNTLL